MNMASTEETVNSILKRFEETLHLSCLQIQENPPSRPNESFNFDHFWSNFNNVTKVVSHEATKLGMMFDGDVLPPTKACQSLIDSIQNACLSLLAVFVTLPQERGKLLHTKISMYVQNVLSTMKNASAAFRTQSASRLQNVGDLWELCEPSQNLPRDERDCLVKLCKEQLDLVEDASTELAQSMMADMEEDDERLQQLTSDFRESLNLHGLDRSSLTNWSAFEKNVVLPCSNLLKALKACIKKTMEAIGSYGDGNSSAGVAELDHLAEYLACGSELADDFVTEVYPPVNHPQLSQKALLIRNNCKTLLLTVRNSHICNPSVERWVNFLEQAVDHNYGLVNDIVLED